MVGVTNKPFILSVIMLSVIMLNVIYAECDTNLEHLIKPKSEIIF